jgi:hypothetical protein
VVFEIGPAAAEPLSADEVGMAAILATRWRNHWSVGVNAVIRTGFPCGEVVTSGVVIVVVRDARASPSLAESAATALILALTGAPPLSRTLRTTEANRFEAERIW